MRRARSSAPRRPERSGGSIEDWDPVAGALYAVEEAAERVAAASRGGPRSSRSRSCSPVRAENHIRGNPDLDDTIARLQAYERAGADVLYAPGLRSTDETGAVCDVVGQAGQRARTPRTCGRDEIFAAGAQRISVGGALTWVATTALTEAATRIRDDGDLSVLSNRPPDRDWLR